MGQEKVGFYNKNNLIEFNTVDSLVYVENPAKNLVSQNIQVHATGKNFVILKSQKNKIQDIKSLIKTQSLEDTTLNKVEPVLK